MGQSIIKNSIPDNNIVENIHALIMIKFDRHNFDLERAEIDSYSIF